MKKYKKFFNIRARKIHFLKYKEFFFGGGVYFFIFSSLGLKSAPGSSILIYKKHGNYYLQAFLEKHYFTEDIKIYCSNSDEEYFNEECINLFIETLKK